MSAAKICPQCNTEFPEDQRFCPRDGSTLKSLSGAGDLVGSVIADRYHVTRKLGEGGMGQVYLAEHVRMGRKSAVKVMHPGMVNDADAISRFNREAANASRINHPNVAAIYDFGETSDGLIYLAMEFVEGEPLTALIERQGALPAARAASIVRQTADALAVAHEFGIVHRDLKPDNIMIARNRDDSDCVKVVDFGIAKAANNEAQKVTRTGLIVGTPEYMSPEQLAGDPLDGRSDVYSLALVAFAMLTGRLPFPSETAQESIISRLTERPRSLAEMKPEVSWPAQLQAVMDRALSRDAAGRYANAAEFGRDFARAIETMPQTVATEAGTSIMAPAGLPATRVAPAPTVAVDATKSRTSRLPLLVGGTTVAVGAIIAFAVLGRPKSDAGQVATPSATVAPTTTTAPAPDTTAGRTAGAGAAPNGGTTGRESAGSGTTRPVANAEARTAAQEPTVPAPAAAIDELRRLSGDPATAGTAISRANALLPRLTQADDSAAALYYQALAYGLQGQETRSCQILRRIGSRGRQDIRSAIIPLLESCPE
ncbi:MAG TPA: serine/threonine-protein kinase [Gemmatimonadaceae bacterium]|nr:serine/threonine-protein kinase [Gemmatimonadaceae bacterium]